MSEWKEIFQFSRAETFALAILLLMVLIGGGILLYRKQHRNSAAGVIFPIGGAATQGKPEVSARSRDRSSPAPPRSQDTIIWTRQESRQDDRTLLLNINTAPAESLMMLPRVGKVISRRIIELRQRLGRFDSVEQLVAVRGIGKKTLELIRPYVTVGDAPSNTAKPDTLPPRNSPLRSPIYPLMPTAVGRSKIRLLTCDKGATLAAN